MKDLPAGGRDSQASLLTGLLTRLRVLARRRNGEGHSLRETLEELIEEDEDETQERAEFTEQERELLLNALSFGELQVWDVMVPRSDIQAIEITAGLAEVVGTMRNAMHTRLPVYRDNLDDVIGMVHIKDLLPYWGDGAEFKLEPIIREVLFVPPSMRVLDLLLQMRDTGVHMAIVVDEYGGTDGLATIEDLVEEIVGEIQDEHDKILPPQIVELPDGALEADARVEVEELERRLGLELLDAERREDVDTLGGLLFTLLDRVPARGEIVRHPAGIEFAVLEADPRRIKRLRIIRAGSGGDERGDLSARVAARGAGVGRWLGRWRSRPRTSALILGALAALTLPPLHLYPLLLAFAGLLRPAAAHRAPAPGVRDRLVLRLRPLPARAVLDRHRLLHRRRALRHRSPCPRWCCCAPISPAFRLSPPGSPCSIAGRARSPRRWSWRSPGPPRRPCAGSCSAAFPGT